MPWPPTEKLQRSSSILADAPLPLRVIRGAGEDDRPPLAGILVEQGALDAADLVKALALQRHQDLPIGEILIAHGMITEAQLLRALSSQFSCRLIDLDHARPDAALAPLLAARRAVALCALPWRRVGSALVVVTNRPDRAAAIRDALAHDGPVLFCIADRTQMQAALTTAYGARLARLAEGRAPGHASCRAWDAARATRGAAMAFVILAAAILMAGAAVVPAFFALVGLVLLANTILKAAALAANLAPPRVAAPAPGAALVTPIRRMPVVTILLPLFKERDIAGDLVARVAKIDYPLELLDVILVVEATDPTTRAALDGVALPPWMRAILVPPGHPQTKPRAMNYALNFARGSIVGIYDAEDAPETDQIRKVAKRFAEAPADVVCLQGQLDFYNPRHNWISRCFTLEYATWFRLMLPGIARLGLVLPLGGTTLFFRRPALEELGAWDAHNVTEDADLGLRLARAGYRTEMIETTTFEEANAALWPWVKQRSRWLKGYAMTWAIHMRQPAKLWRELGPRRFLGFQVQFMGAILGFVIAPVLWSFLVKLGGWPHPLDPWVSPAGYKVLFSGFIICEVLTIAAVWRATRLDRHRPLRFWIPALEPYFLMATVATLIGLWELARRPFHWAKTAHGGFSEGLSPVSVLVAPRTDPPAPPIAAE